MTQSDIATAPAAPAQGIGPDTISRTVLPNGTVVLIYPNHAIPAVNITWSCEAGAVFEPAERNGLAGFTARLMRRGTKRQTFERLNQETEERGMSVGVDAGRHTLSVGGRSLAEDTRFLIDTIADIARHPAFPLDEIEKLRTLILTGLKEEEDDTRSMAERAFRELAYPADHPYHRRVSGTLDTVPLIQRADMLGFYRGFVRPDTAIIVIVGDVDPAATLRMVEDAFGDWAAAGPRPAAVVPDAPRPTTTARAMQVLAGKTQNDLVLGLPGIRRADPDYYAMQMMNLLLGRLGLYGRLGRSVREEQGLAYYAYSSFDAGRGPGPWAVRAGVNPTNVQRAVASILREITRIREEPVAEKELADGTTFLTGVLPLQLETNSGLAGVLFDMEFYGLGLDYVQRYPAIIRGLTIADVQRAAQRYLPAEAYVLGVAGPEVELASEA